MPAWLRAGKALWLTFVSVCVLASKPPTERASVLLLPVPLGVIDIEGAGMLLLRVVALWLPIWLAACLYTHLAFHLMAASLCLTACSLAGGWRSGARDRNHAACWALAAASCSLLADAWMEAVSRLAFLQPASAWRYVTLSVLPQLATALACAKICQLHKRWASPAALELDASDTITSAYTISLRRVAKKLLSCYPLTSYQLRLQLTSLVMAAHAARLYFLPVAPAGSLPEPIRVLLLDSPALIFVAITYVCNDWDRAYGTGSLAEQHSWDMHATGEHTLEFTCACDEDEDDVDDGSGNNSFDIVQRAASPQQQREVVARAPRGGGNDKKAPPPPRHPPLHDRTQVYSEISRLLSPDTAAFDVSIYLLLYGDRGGGFRTHAHAEAVIEIRECPVLQARRGGGGGGGDGRRAASASSSASAANDPSKTVVLKIGFFLDQFSILAVRGKRVTTAWPQPGYKESGYRGGNVLLAPGSFFSLGGCSGWSRDAVEEALRRTVNLASHPFKKGYAKIPQPGEYNCFAYSLNIVSIWLGGACPFWSLGSLRTIACLASSRGIGVETWAAAMLMMLLQLPQPFNYAFGQLESSLDRGIKLARKETTHLGRLGALWPALIASVESVAFIITVPTLLSQVLLTNNFELIFTVGFLCLANVRSPWSMR